MFIKCKLAASTAIACCVLAAPAFAAPQTGGSAGTAAQRLVNSSANTIQQLSSNKNFTKMLRQAKGVFIVPTFAKGAVIVGGSGGTGVLVAHTKTKWSDPAFFTIGSISVGAQAGGKAGPLVMFLMTDKAVSSFTQSNNFSLNGNANLTVANWSPNGQGSIGKGDVVVWSGTSGLFAGLNVSGSDVVADTKEDQAYYKDKQVGTKQIVDQDVTSAQAGKLLAALPG